MAGGRTSKSQEKRKSSKPLMEKRRRARINECLSDLQKILEATNDGQTETTGGHSKREKAEILEQTVQLVRQLRHTDQPGISNSGPLPQAQYRAGFNECLNEVSRFMEANNSALHAETRSGLLNHLAASLGSRPPPVQYNGWAGAGQFGPGPGKAVPREIGANGRPVLDRGCTAVAPAHLQSQHSVKAPPRASVPPLATPSIGSQTASSHAIPIPIQQSPRKGEHPNAACVPTLTPATQGVALPVTLPSAPAGHVALVLPAHLLGSFVGGQFATGQVISLYQHQGASPVIQQQQASASRASVVLPAASVGVGGALSSPSYGQAAKLDNQCATGFSNAGMGQIFIVPSQNIGCYPAMAPTRPEASSSSLNPGRGIPVSVSIPPTPPSSLVAMGTRSQNGVVYAPASLPMQLYVAPSAHSGGASGPFANGPSLPNPSPMGLGPHWRPWGWDQDPR